MESSKQQTIDSLSDTPVEAKPTRQRQDWRELLRQSLGGALWLPQAACLAAMVAELMAPAPSHVTMAVLTGIFFVLWVIRSAVDSRVTLGNTTRAARVVRTCREQALERFAASSPLTVGRPASGALASVLTEQAQNILTYLSRYQPAQARVMVIPLLIVIVVFPLSWVAAIILFVSAPLIPIFMALVGWRAKAASERHLVELADMNAFMLDRLRAMQTLRALDAIDESARLVNRRAHNLKKRIMAVLRIAFLSSAVLELFAALGVAMVAVYIGFHLLGNLNFGAWGHKLTLAEGLFILMLAPTFYEPLRDLASAWHDRADGQAALTQISNLGDNLQPLPGTQPHAAHSADPQNQTPAVSIQHLTFRYGNQAESVFEDLNLDIQAGEHVALMMPSGGGKSTLLALLAGLITPQDGQIRIGDRTLDGDTAAQLREEMAWIGQKPHIFAGSLLNNITLGRMIEPNVLARAIEQARLERLLVSRGNLALAEGGAGMSGGELVRLSIARALVDPAAKLLLVDEPTAHLDSQTARELTDQLIEAGKGRTMIVVTHDPILAARADRIIHLERTMSREVA